MNEKRYDGWLFRYARQFWCGMVHGHEWKNKTSTLVGYVYQECAKCGKGRIF